MHEKNLEFRFNHKDQVDKIYEVMTSTQIKAAFDSRAEDIRDYIYTLIDRLSSMTANSGAKNIGFNADKGINATNVQDAIDVLKNDIKLVTLSQIPDGTLDDLKFSNAKGQIKDTVSTISNNLLNAMKALEELSKEYGENKQSIKQSIADIETVLKDKVNKDTLDLILNTPNLPSLKTDVLMTPLTGCSGGFVNIESVQGKTEIKDGKLVSVGEPVGVGNNLADISIFKTQPNFTNIAGYFKVWNMQLKPNTSYKLTSTLDKKGNTSPYDSYAWVYSHYSSSSDNMNYKDSQAIYHWGAGTGANSTIKTDDTGILSFVWYKGTCIYDIWDIISNLQIKELAYRIEIISRKNKNLFNINGNVNDGDPTYPKTNKTVGDKLLVTNWAGSYHGLGQWISVNVGVPLTFKCNSDLFSYVEISNDIWTTDYYNASGTSYSTTFTPTQNKILVKFITGNQNTTVSFSNIQLMESSLDQTYEPYKGDKTEILMKEPLRKISDTIYDFIDTNGVITRNCSQITLNGSENWTYDGNTGTNSIYFYCGINEAIGGINDIINTKNDKFISTTWNVLSNYDSEFLSSNENKLIIIKINKNKLTAVNVSGFKTWLSQNPVTVVYQLATPVTENTNKNLALRAYDNLIVNAGALQPQVTYSYAKNTGGRIESIEDSVSSINQRFKKGYDELFQFANTSLQSANNGKAVIAEAVGGVTGQNSFQEISNYINSKRNEIGSRLSSGDYATLGRINDWTALRQRELASQLVAKGVSASSNENLGQLISKVAGIYTGLQYATGETTVVFPAKREYDGGTGGISLVEGPMTVSNMTFKPGIVIYSVRGKYPSDINVNADNPKSYMRWMGQLGFEDKINFYGDSTTIADSKGTGLFINNGYTDFVATATGFTAKLQYGCSNSHTGGTTTVKWLALGF